MLPSSEIMGIVKPQEVITPELIEKVYDVDASVGFDEDGELFVLPKRVRRGHDTL